MSIITVNDNTYAVIVPNATTNVIALTQQGPEGIQGEQGLQGSQGIQGIQGLKGDPGGSFLSPVLAAPISGNAVVAFTADGFNYADSSITAHRGHVVGVTTAAGITGEVITVATSGSVVNGFTGLVPNAVYYLSTAGGITAMPPTVGFVQQIGIAKSTTELTIVIGVPIALA